MEFEMEKASLQGKLITLWEIAKEMDYFTGYG